MTIDPAAETHHTLTIDAEGIYYKELNAMLRQAVADGVQRIDILNVTGQRYIGTDLDRPVEIHVHGTPGNDLGAFMNGPRVHIYGNAQDATGNTMNEGEIVIHGNAGDITGYSMRGGKLFVRGNVGYRVGIHMKEYKEKKPIVVIGGTAQPFLGEYMAGGVLLVLGLTLPEGAPHKANFIGTGMHAGVMYIRGTVEKHQLGKEVSILEPDDQDRILLRKLVAEYCAHFQKDPEPILSGHFIKVLPLSKRPYGNLYTPA
ncbi:MAG: hypothetical protein EPO21_11275 [Chloroflexota bacterium]|nr:MAG: hypothetical protein EPO21_11275 [Chloroflexota bacterium]